MKQPKVETRPMRSERSEPIQLHNDDSIGWAVSYSDLLMVLMSFFIVFFSIESDKSPDVMRQIFSSINGSQGKGGNAGDPALVGQETQSGEMRALPIEQGLLNGFDLKVSTAAKEPDITVVFPDDLYPSREFILPAKAKARLYDLLGRLMPYRDQIEINFIGHSDNRRVTPGDWLLSDNIQLSSLRASHAAKLAISMGFSESNISASSSKLHDRETRSISVRISPRTPERAK